MKLIGTAVAALAAVLLAACDGPSIENNPRENAAHASRKSIEGYGDLKFGTTLMQTIEVTGSERFNSYGLKKCLEDLPLKGCFLSPDSDAAPYLIEAAIPYKLGLDFNKFDKLTDISLSYDREGRISFDECRSLHERTVDWVASRYGQQLPHNSRKETLEERRTPAENVYLLWRSRDGHFVTAPSRTAAANLAANVQRKPIMQWDNERYVSLLSHFIVVNGNPMCHIGIEFSEPQSVERRPTMEETATSFSAESRVEVPATASGPVDEDDAVAPLIDENGQPLNDAHSTDTSADI